MHEIRELTIAPRRSTEFVMDGAESESGLLHSLFITSDKKPGEVQSKLVSRSDGNLYQVELLGKDEKDPDNGGLHPWSIEGDSESHLLLFNHSATPKVFDVAIASGAVIWNKKYTVGISETIEISFNQLIGDKVKDDRGHVLSPDRHWGTVTWMVPDFGDAKGRLMVTSHSAAMARNFSCESLTVICGLGVPVLQSDILIGNFVDYATGEPSFCSTPDSNPTCGGPPLYSGSATYNNSISPTSIVQFNTGSDQVSQSPNLYGVSGGTGSFRMTAEAGGCQSDGNPSPPPTVQVPKYFFSPSESSVSLPPACTQKHYTGYFIDVLYYVADANSNRISMEGMAPGEYVGGVWQNSFATPPTTRADGSFDDVPRGACYSESGHYCATGTPQTFQITTGSKVYPISTNTTSRLCTDGIKLVIQGNPTAQNKTYNLGNTE